MDALSQRLALLPLLTTQQCKHLQGVHHCLVVLVRLSAARSKLRQKLAHEGQRVKLDMLASQKLKLASEMEQLKRLCEELEEAQIQLPAPTAACGEVRYRLNRLFRITDRPVCLKVFTLLRPVSSMYLSAPCWCRCSISACAGP